MFKLLLTAISASVLAAAVPATRTLPEAARELPVRSAVEPEGQGGLALEALENLMPGLGDSQAPITFAVVADLEALPADGTYPMDDMTAWQVQILNSSGEKVSFIQGSGRLPPPAIYWSGTAPGGEPLPGGFYSARLVWMDGAKKVHSARPVSFNLFSPLAVPKFAELELDFRFTGGFPL